MIYEFKYILISLFATISIVGLCSCNENVQENNKENVVKSDSVKTIGSDNLLRISGDFDGDGIPEKLFEYFISQDTKQPIVIEYENDTDYADLVDKVAKMSPKSFLISDDNKIDTLHISTNPQLFGILFLKNEGDLNNDGNDDVSYVINNADWSSLNTYHIVTYKNSEWDEIASFPIWEWQIDELSDNQGLVKSLENSKIECYSRNNDAEVDTILLSL